MNSHPKFNSVIEALAYWHSTAPNKPYCSIVSLSGEEDHLTFDDLYQESCAYASWLQSQGLQKGDRVILAVPNGRSFLSGFLGTLMAGGVAVPVVCRNSILSGFNRVVENLGHIFRDAAAKYILTTQSNQGACEDALKAFGQIATISTVETLPKSVQFSQDPLKIFPEDIAFIQYTSGSTSLPKGVVVRHHQLIAQLESIVHGLKSNVKDCAVSWLPLFHDMGLIGTFLHSLYVGMKLILMEPERFIFDPKEWLRAISKHKATLSTGPNSAYSICLSRIEPSELEGIDLSSWRVAFTGAEPIQASTIEAFIEKFKPFGFDPKAFVAGYGMAENCLAITFCQSGEGLRYDTILKKEFELHQKAVTVPTGDSEPMLTFVSVGTPIQGHEVVIVNENGVVLGDRCVGEIVARGPARMDGYFQKEAVNKKVIRNGWLYTGDLGYLAEGQLYVVGRKKDMIIKGGRNYCPQDIELACEGVSGVKKGCVVAFGVPEAQLGTEELIVIAEIKPMVKGHEKRIEKEISAAIFDQVGIRPGKILLFPIKVLTKTTSGKIQRAKAKEQYLQGNLMVPISWRERLRYFRFRLNLFISMCFYYLSGWFKRWIQHAPK
ncbi:MAG: fatty acyl-AMP ligase [Deltaproteobacteria bacterium]|nr:fatty acyl-AMP ligase [Deltaproteobacteria bacterium]